LKNAVLSIGILVLGTIQAPQPAGSISGRVRDMGAAGVAGASILRLRLGTLSYRDGRRVFSQSGTVQVDASGNYSLENVKPGEYYVRADLSSTGMATYYPGTLEIDRATTITVEAGQEIVGIDFEIRNNPTFKISGTIRNMPAAAASNGLANSTLGTAPVLGMTVASADRRSPDPSSGPLLQSTRSGANGEFEISLPAGEWDIFPVIPLRASSPTPAATLPTYATGRARVLLTDRNIDNVVINVGSADIVGRIFVRGALGESAPVGPPPIFLLPLDNYPSPLISHLRTAQRVEASGEFKFAAVPPGQYALQITIPSDLYLAEMRVGTKSIYDDGAIDVGIEPMDPVEVVLRRDGGSVRVAITGRDPAAGVSYAKRIVLVPVERRKNALLYKVTAFTDSSHEVVGSVAPGRYRVFAFQQLPPGGAEQNADFMAKYEDFGVTIEVAAGQTIDVQVPFIPSGK
jgi:hypothetical protein